MCECPCPNVEIEDCPCGQCGGASCIGKCPDTQPTIDVIGKACNDALLKSVKVIAPCSNQ